MANTMFGITGIKVRFFICENENADELNMFLHNHDGDIIDIQYQQNNFVVKQVMVVYQEK